MYLYKKYFIIGGAIFLFYVISQATSATQVENGCFRIFNVFGCLIFKGFNVLGI